MDGGKISTDSESAIWRVSVFLIAALISLHVLFEFCAAAARNWSFMRRQPITESKEMHTNWEKFCLRPKKEFCRMCRGKAAGHGTGHANPFVFVFVPLIAVAIRQQISSRALENYWNYRRQTLIFQMYGCLALFRHNWQREASIVLRRYRRGNQFQLQLIRMSWQSISARINWLSENSTAECSRCSESARLRRKIKDIPNVCIQIRWDERQNRSRYVISGFHINGLSSNKTT